MSQMRFETMKDLKPPAPSLLDEAVATKIAMRIVTDVNMDEFYWSSDELNERVNDVRDEIMTGGDPGRVFDRLRAKHKPTSASGKREGHPYGFNGIALHCSQIATEITGSELIDAVKRYIERYES